MINPWGGELRTARMSEVVTSGTCVHWVILHLSRAVWSSAVVSIEVDESCERIVRADATMLPALALCHYCVRHAEPTTSSSSSVFGPQVHSARRPTPLTSQPPSRQPRTWDRGTRHFLFDFSPISKVSPNSKSSKLGVEVQSCCRSLSCTTDAT